MLNPHQRQQLRQRTLALIEELTELQGSTAQASETVELDQTRQGRLSRMDALQGQAMAQASYARAVARLHSLQQALERMDTDDYGECLECGEAIPLRRLEIDPSLRLCVSCAENSDN
ncbi:MAG: TraR/DksA family transcriptional regulator [Salinisphaeraceae bacterium]|nr:TraR/DksA family transcriptional regulator [Salinisphaeraceae bacterium]